MEKCSELIKAFSPFTIAGFIFAILAGFAGVFAGFGSQWEWFHFRTGFLILRYAAYGGIVAAVLSLVGAILNRPWELRGSFIASILGLLLGLLVFIIPLCWWWTAQRVPPIHDITTDTENPPRFVSILSLRKDAPNPAEYGGPEIAAQQRVAYPDIVPARSSIPPDKAFERALAAAQGMGWKIVDKNPGEGRIEATDTTFWFGFKDDIVIRVTPADSASRIDIRSVSRVGRSDVGTNAKRIRKFLKKIAKGPSEE